MLRTPFDLALSDLVIVGKRAAAEARRIAKRAGVVVADVPPAAQTNPRRSAIKPVRDT